MNGGITIKRYQPEQAEEWKKFLAESNNGTLFHDLDFLSYHEAGKFDTHHLMFQQNENLVALLPAAIVTEPDGRRFLKSPYGASVGGIVISLRSRLHTALSILDALKSYAKKIGLNGIEMRISPNIYLIQPNDLVSFGLTLSSFKLINRWLTFIAPLSLPIDKLLSKEKRYDVRSNLKKGLNPREVGIDGLDLFYDLLTETMSRHRSTPTHQRNELMDIFKKVPGRIRLFLCAHEGEEVAGVLVFILNKSAAYTFYICESYEFRKMCGPAVLIAHIIDKLAQEGIKYLDLGPSASITDVNKGVVFFKEGLGANGFCRDLWRWETGI
ncbi:MAG: GNAT family N-acetyltransferase [Deltaproteobacteria bacterium]|nr:GNAT family N-acetyltransferase [Deltaproteobacteria bacterium]